MNSLKEIKKKDDNSEGEKMERGERGINNGASMYSLET